MSEREAFFQVCQDAQPAKAYYVSLYRTEPYYGGPEEGGWWGHDRTLVAYQECQDEETARYLERRVETLADKLSREAKNDFNRQCAAEMEWLEARGLDADYLPEVDGEIVYWVTVETQPGEHTSTGPRHYE